LSDWRLEDQKLFLMNYFWLATVTWCDKAEGNWATHLALSLGAVFPSRKVKSTKKKKAVYDYLLMWCTPKKERSRFGSLMVKLWEITGGRSRSRTQDLVGSVGWWSSCVVLATVLGSYCLTIEDCRAFQEVISVLFWRDCLEIE
jgi:hypothetical protein